MANYKQHFGKQGLVASANLDTVFQREIFFPVDPATLDGYNPQELQDEVPSGGFVEIDLDTFLPFLPELEQEIFFLIFRKQKGQKDIARLLGLSQPTISYRYRRVLVKLSYLMVLIAVRPDVLLAELDFLKDYERLVLLDLMYYTNQELVGKKHDVRQSSVKWIFVKTKKRLREMELQEPEKWGAHYCLMMLLARHLNSRILY